MTKDYVYETTTLHKCETRVCSFLHERSNWRTIQFRHGRPDMFGILLGSPGFGDRFFITDFFPRRSKIFLSHGKAQTQQHQCRSKANPHRGKFTAVPEPRTPAATWNSGWKCVSFASTGATVDNGGLPPLFIRYVNMHAYMISRDDMTLTCMSARLPAVDLWTGPFLGLKCFCVLPPSFDFRRTKLSL